MRTIKPKHGDKNYRRATSREHRRNSSGHERLAYTANGKLVGAVTHVFVNAPDKGYAIFAENMLSDYANATGLYVNEAA